MKIKIFTIVFAFLFVGNLLAQKGSDSLKIQRLEKIYRNLEYNTTAFNDLKNKWYVTDPIYVREIYNRFIVNNGLLINGRKPTREELLKMTEDIYAGNVFIELRKRYYDDEIDQLRFFKETKVAAIDSTKEPEIKREYFFDPINDYVFIKDILGDTIYNDLKEQFYAYTDLTKEPYGNKQAYNFDLYLNLFNPKVQFWSITTSNKNKYLVSFFSKWGNDYILFPGWYYPDIFPGVKVSYIDHLKNNEPYLSYSVEIGFGIPVKQTMLEFNKDVYGPRIFHSGSNIYFNIFGNPFRLFTHKLDNLDLTLTGMFSITTYKSSNYHLNYKSQFYANRDFISFVARYNDILEIMNLGWFYASLGLTSYDIYHYLLDPNVSDLVQINPSPSGNFEHMLSVDFGLSEYTGLLIHDIATQFSYNITKSYGYAGVKAHFLLSNVIGLDFKFFTSFGISQAKMPFFRRDTYIIFSPIIKINY
jgi:hypothetical protein